MPKNVNHQQRQDDIARAAFELIARDGLMNASVRAVADYSGYSAGSIRHYFPAHEELLRYVSNYLTQRISNRISAITQDEKITVRQRVEKVCEQLLPLDTIRKQEIIAYAELGRLERTQPTGRLAEGQGIDKVCEISLAALDEHHILSEARRMQLAHRLHWVLDGLAAQEIIYPSYITPAGIQAELRQTLDDIEHEIAEATVTNKHPET